MSEGLLCPPLGLAVPPCAASSQVFPDYAASGPSPSLVPRVLVASQDREASQDSVSSVWPVAPSSPSLGRLARRPEGRPLPRHPGAVDSCRGLLPSSQHLPKHQPGRVGDCRTLTLKCAEEVAGHGDPEAWRGSPAVAELCRRRLCRLGERLWGLLKLQSPGLASPFTSMAPGMTLLTTCTC